MNKKVSIIIPVYNGERFIERSLTSILNQTYDDIECIVVNDGSEDKTELCVEKMKTSFDSRGYTLKYIACSENKGSASAVSMGLKYVTGEYLSLLDADDILMEDSIELRADFLNANTDYGLVLTDGCRVYEDDLDSPIEIFSSTTKTQYENEYFEDLLCGKAYGWSGTYMVRTSLVWDAYPDKEIYKSRYGQNLQIILPVAYRSKCGYVDKLLMKYVNQKGSLSVPKNDSERLDNFLNNMLGYKDIRLHLLNQIVKDEVKMQYLQTKIDALYNRIFLKQYANLGDLKKSREYYLKLKELNENTADDLATVFRIKSRIISKLIRVLKIR